MATQKNTRRHDTYSPQMWDKFQDQRDQLNAEINGDKLGANFVPKTKVISFEIFQKTSEERLELKEAKRKHKAFTKRANPKSHRIN